MTTLTTNELKYLRIAWLAWRDINSPLFIKEFKTIWKREIEGIESILRKCNWKMSLKNFSRIGVTLNPEVDFAFSLIPESFFFNVWSFLFCQSNNQAFCRPLSLLSNEIVHEYAHFKFYRKEGILGSSKREKQLCEKTLGVKSEKYALSQEALFLKRLKEIVPERVSIRLFKVNSWTDQGTPIYEVETAEIELKKQIKSYVSNCKKKLKYFKTKEKYDREMVHQKTLSQNTLSSIIGLRTPKFSPTREISLKVTL